MSQSKDVGVIPGSLHILSGTSLFRTKSSLITYHTILLYWLTDVLMVTTTVRMLDGVHGHTTNLERAMKRVKTEVIQ